MESQGVSGSIAAHFLRGDIGGGRRTDLTPRSGRLVRTRVRRAHSERAALTPLFEDPCFRERAFQQLFVGDEK